MNPSDPPENFEETSGFPSHHGQSMSNVEDTLILDNTIGRHHHRPNSRFSRSPEKDLEAAEAADDTVIQEPAGSEPISQMSVEQWLESLRRNDRTFYNMMAMEVWSIAKSMDTLIPGFWNKFMQNRQLAVQNFVVKRRIDKPTGLRLEDLGNPDGTPIPPIDSKIDSKADKKNP